MHPVGNIEELTAALERLTRELECSDRRFRDVIERTPDAILVVDREGVVRFANGAARALFAGRHADLVGTPFGFPLLAGETTELDMLTTRGVRVAEMRVVETEWDGGPASIASLRDITERKLAEEHARRLIRERAARTAAEDSAHTLRFLVDATTLLSSSLDYATTLAALARLCVAEIADWSVVYALDDRGSPSRLEIAHCDARKAGAARELQRIPIARGSGHPVIEVLRTRRPRVVNDVSDEIIATMSSNPRELEIIRELGVSGFIMVPIVARDRPLGALALVSASPERRFDDGDLALATDIAGRAALAIDNARLYGEAQRANQSKTDFLAVVSHDLRTPLTAIIGYADLLDLGIPKQLPVESRESIRRVRTSARHLLYLLNELLVFARLDGGAEDARLVQYDVSAVAREAAAVMEPLARERGLRFRVSLPDAPATAETDPDKLRQVLINVMGNAVKYTEAGEVSVHVTRRDDEILIAVRDTGPGIAPEHLDRIFEPFWQVDRTQRSKGGGTGLGLSVVRRMLELIGGEIHVASTPGDGSVFTVRVPRVSRDQEGAPGGRPATVDAALP
jgi:signal transduction histidine kinase